MTQWKALILEDDRVCRRLMEVYIQRLGGHTVSVSSVAQARAMLIEQQFDICVTDLVLGESRAHTMWCDLAEAGGNKLPRLLVVTGVEPAAAKAMMGKVEIAEILHKPVQWRAFSSAIQDCLGSTITIRHPALVPTVPERGAELHALMRQSMAAELAQVRACLAGGEQGQAERLLHKLRGALRTAGWQAQADDVRQAEQLLADGMADAARDVLGRLHDGM